MQELLKSVWIRLFLLLIAVYMAWCYAVLSSDSWRYRITVSVETPEGVKTGSAVQEFSIERGFNTFPHVEIKGQAVVVDLGKRGVLFALLRESPVADKKLKGKIVVKPNGYPVFVRFRDMTDPRTVEILSEPDVHKSISKSDSQHLQANFENAFNKSISKGDSQNLQTNFESAFGVGVRVKEVTIEITSDKISGDVEKYLPWTSQVKDYISGQSASMYGVRPVTSEH